MSFQDVAGLDPTGILPAAAAGIALVGSVLRLVPAIKGVSGAGARGGPPRAATGPPGPGAPPPSAAAGTVPASAYFGDQEADRRAYETVNYVLREFGSRLGEMGLVNSAALTKALSGATKHIEVRLFSTESNRLFESLASRLADPILVTSVFTSIYFIGALTAELTSSLPNYKESYTPLGPRMVQQFFRAAIGEDAFRDNMSANLDAYKTLATTAGLLRPTDIGYSTFPGFPSLSPCRYSTKSSSSVRANKNIYAGLMKHFDKFGFPQPLQRRAVEVGAIRDWRFLSSDSNSRTFEVEKADKHIGENFGRVLHWLMCSTDRMPVGVAVVAYLDQHIELINWVGERMGCCILRSSDLDLSGAHAKLDKKARAVIDSWVILMGSERTQTNRRVAAANWHRAQIPIPAPVAPPAQAPPPVNNAPQAQWSTPMPTRSASVAAPSYTGHPMPPPQPVQQQPPPVAVNVSVPPLKSPADLLVECEMDFFDNLLPPCQRFVDHPPVDPKYREFDQKFLIDSVERTVILRLDEIQTPGDDDSRQRRRNLIIKAQKIIHEMEEVTSVPTPTNLSRTTSSASGPMSLDERSSIPASSPATSPPPYSPTGSAFPFPSKRPLSVVRRKAPPPPKKVYAKALYDFEPDEENDEELGFKEGDDLEIVEKTAALDEEGWCRAKLKGTVKIGLVPLDYLEQIKGPAVPATITEVEARPTIVSSNSAPSTVPTFSEKEAVVSQSPRDKEAPKMMPSITEFGDVTPEFYAMDPDYVPHGYSGPSQSEPSTSAKEPNRAASAGHNTTPAEQHGSAHEYYHPASTEVETHGVTSGSSQPEGSANYYQNPSSIQQGTTSVAHVVPVRPTPLHAHTAPYPSQANSAYSPAAPKKSTLPMAMQATGLVVGGLTSIAAVGGLVMSANGANDPPAAASTADTTTSPPADPAQDSQQTQPPEQQQEPQDLQPPPPAEYTQPQDPTYQATDPYAPPQYDFGQSPLAPLDPAYTGYAPQEQVVIDPYGASPLAGLAPPPPTLVEDQSLPVSTFTEDTQEQEASNADWADFDAQQEQNNAEWTAWEADDTANELI
ncbi:MAG: hypothetical protein M4579_005536 [Chaenotheca gracillima]|nr:MAG: hypothetical protein M4579_005536 [Chaenotheca gracillima]